MWPRGPERRRTGAAHALQMERLESVAIYKFLNAVGASDFVNFWPMRRVIDGQIVPFDARLAAFS
jgi:hypothetical protein